MSISGHDLDRRCGQVSLPDGSSIDARRFAALVQHARAVRAEPLLGAWATDSLDEVSLGPVFDDLWRAEERSLSLVVMLEWELCAMAERLERAGVPFRVLKGPAIAHLDERIPSMRPFGDLDLLVRSADIARAIDVVTAAGGTRRIAEPRRGFDRRFSKGVSFGFERNLEVDLHRTLALGVFGLTIDLDELFEGTQTLSVAGMPLAALDRPSRFLHACLHLVLGGPWDRPSLYRDVMLTVPVDEPEAALVAERAARWRLTAVVQHAMHMVRQACAWLPPETTAALTVTPASREQRAWLATVLDHRRLAGHRQSVRVIRGVRAKLAYTASVAAPRAPGHTSVVARVRLGLNELFGS